MGEILKGELVKLKWTFNSRGRVWGFRRDLKIFATSASCAFIWADRDCNHYSTIINIIISNQYQYIYGW